MTYKWMPVILEDRCTGCGLCAEACGPRSLAMAEGISVLTAPDTCGSEEHCIAACKDEAIQMAWVAFEGDRAVGRWRVNSESENPLGVSAEAGGR